MLEIGTKAPEFSLPDQDGVMRSLSDWRGQKVVLYFYPKDMTSGCTSQACSFGDMYPQFREKGATVIGVSKDTVASHKRFQEKYGLPFTLLADPEMEVLAAYDVLVEGVTKTGRVSRKLIRSTYLINEEGMITRAFGKVKAKDNAKQMLDELE
ncbi:MAG: peroxiredoxin [Atopobiaceae bacterium]|nr:peroxiredoxin [Atopobiaceae bacterium]MBR1828448.1 peroxiredoxin [Atopobiaceae bacterium]